MARRRVRDRLSEQDVATLVESFRNGTPAHVLAERYGIGETSAKALLRQRGVRRIPKQPPAEITAQQTRIKKLNQRAKRNKEAYFADALSLEEFKTEQDKTREEIAAAEKIIAKLTVTLDSIRQGLDEALSILVDPYRLFTEAPDTIRLMLTQAVFDKLWIMDHQVVGSELTDTYHELLTVEARLTLEEQAAAEPGADGLSQAPAVRTYYRQRTGGSRRVSGHDPDELAERAERLWIERPQGHCPWTARTPLHTR